MSQIIGKRTFGNGPVEGALDPFTVGPCKDIQSSIETTRTDQPPSCIELYRDDNRVFVIGTYKLLDADPNAESQTSGQKRIGSITLIRLDPTYSKIEKKVEVKFKQAVFDLHFHPKHHDLLGVATSSNKISFFKLRTAPLSLDFLFSLPVHEDANALATFFSWSPFPSKKGCISFGVTFSDGWVTYFEDIPLRPPPKTKRSVDAIALQSHTLEAWFLTFYMTMIDGPNSKPEITRRALTGGDDASLIANSIPKLGTSKASGPSPSTIFTDTRLHSAGVTSILPLPSLRSHLGSGDLLLTGSYDEHIRLFHISPSHPSKRTVLSDKKLDGGVWRIKLLSDIHLTTRSTDVSTISTIKFLVLASCMHAGPKILRYSCTFPSDKKIKTGDKTKWDVEVLTTFKEHESMNYGSEWTVDEGGEVVVVSTSFYDGRICLWRPFSGGKKENEEEKGEA